MSYHGIHLFNRIVAQITTEESQAEYYDHLNYRRGLFTQSQLALKPTFEDAKEYLDLKTKWEGKYAMDYPLPERLQIRKFENYHYNYDWRDHLFHEGEFCGLASAVDEVILPPIYKDVFTNNSSIIEIPPFIPVFNGEAWALVTPGSDPTNVTEFKYKKIILERFQQNIFFVQYLESGKWGALEIYYPHYHTVKSIGQIINELVEPPVVVNELMPAIADDIYEDEWDWDDDAEPFWMTRIGDKIGVLTKYGYTDIIYDRYEQASIRGRDVIRLFRNDRKRAVRQSYYGPYKQSKNKKKKMTIKGKYTSAEIFTGNIEDAALDWVRAQCDHKAFDSVRIVQMPDVHAGNSCNVGTAYRIGAYVNPDHVGVDIGCTISMHRLSAMVNPEDFALLDHRIREVVPTGTDICEKNSLNEKDFFKFLNAQYNKARSAAPDLINEAPRIDARFITDFCRRIKLQEGIFYKSIGTLGGGNHFIEYGEDKEKNGWLTIHCGSRNLGVKVANHWHNIANNPKRGEYIGFLWGDALNGYLSDMIIAQAYALYNHHVIRDRIFAILRKLCKAKCVESIFTTHNYISVTEEHPMLRKGAIDASEGEKVCIPFNMCDGIAICMGKGNEKWLNSAPHGAGRIMSRAKARKEISMEEYESRMRVHKVFSTSICEGTLDESPQAYKPTAEIMELIKPTVDIITMVRPKLNIKDNGE